MVFWDKIFNNIKNSYPNIESRSIHIDAMAGFFIMKPWMFEVVTASNLFGDILTDLGSAMLGSIGISPSANINPEKKFPSMFEPVHGSAPDIAGQGKANPTGTVWSIVLMLDHLGLENAAKLLMSALESVIRKGKFVTGDIGGSATTAEMCRAIVKRIKENVD
jgi:tartrate dehydrogenase/decarboxylase/D-malate dehydrogenase